MLFGPNVWRDARLSVGPYALKLYLSPKSTRQKQPTYVSSRRVEIARKLEIARRQGRRRAAESLSLALDSDVLELAEQKSGQLSWSRILPRSPYPAVQSTLLLALDFNEVDDPSGLAQDNYGSSSSMLSTKEAFR